MPWRGVWLKVATPAVRSRIEANPGGGGHRAADFDSVRATGYENLGGFASHTFWLDSGDAKIYHGEGVFSPEVRRTVAQRKRLGPQPWVGTGRLRFAPLPAGRFSDPAKFLIKIRGERGVKVCRGQPAEGPA